MLRHTKTQKRATFAKASQGQKQEFLTWLVLWKRPHQQSRFYIISTVLILIKRFHG